MSSDSPFSQEPSFLSSSWLQFAFTCNVLLTINTNSPPELSPYTPSITFIQVLMKPLYANTQSSSMPKPSSTRETLPYPVVQYAWLITMTRMCCECYPIVVISFILNVSTPGYACMLHARCVETRLFLRWWLQWKWHPDKWKSSFITIPSAPICKSDQRGVANNNFHTNFLCKTEFTTRLLLIVILFFLLSFFGILVLG